MRERPHPCDVATGAARKSGPRAVVALMMSMRWEFDDTRRGPGMNLNTIEEVRSATAIDGGAVEWREGDSWLAGGPGSSPSRSRSCAACSICAISTGRRWRWMTTAAHRRHLYHRRPLCLPRAPGLAGVVRHR